MKLPLGIYQTFKIVCSKIICFLNHFATKKTNVIFVRPDRLGDFILWMDTVKRYREVLPNKRIGLICNTYNAEIATKSGLFDRVVAINMENKKEWIKLLGNKTDMVVLPCAHKIPYYGLIVRSICARVKIMSSSPEGDSCNNQWFLKSFTVIADIPYLFPDSGRKMPEAYRNVLLLNYLTGQSFDKIRLADLSFLFQKPVVDEPYFVLNLGASLPSRIWPVERFVTVASMIEEKTGWLCVLIGNKNELPFSEQFKNNFTGRCSIFTGKTNLTEMISLVASAQMVLCNDTSTVHIAAACHTRCLCVAPQWSYDTFTNYRTGLVDTDDETTLPVSVCAAACFGCDTHCVDCKINHNNDTLPCVLSITTTMVCAELQKMSSCGL